MTEEDKQNIKLETINFFFTGKSCLTTVRQKTFMFNFLQLDDTKIVTKQTKTKNKKA